MQQVTLIGFGAIGRSLFARMAGHPGVRITHIVVSEEHVADVQAAACRPTPDCCWNARAIRP
jgi:pyrroline-5-carboxylate reductase